MRTLDTGPAVHPGTVGGTYTAAQVSEALTASTGRISARFDILDPSGNRLGALTGVDAATVEMNVDRTVKGSLTLRMLPEPSLIDMLFRRRIRPWLQVGMPDGGIAEWPMGTYVWGVPRRALTAVEMWDVICGDLTHVLDAGGPGPGGWSVTAGTVVTDAIAGVLLSIGITDLSRITPSSSTLAQPLTWDVIDGGRPTTWGRILTDLHQAIGYYGPFFDLSGRYVAKRQPDLRSATADVTYQTASDSILLAAATDQELARIANRVIVRAASAAGIHSTAEADADVLYPGHPLAPSVVGFHIDQVVDDAVAGSAADLQARADAQLAQSLSMYQRAELRTLAWPAHEAYDVIGVRWADDPELGTVQRFHERRWTMNLLTGEMTHELRRIVSI